MHERRNSEKTNIKSTFSVSHPIHHPSPCAENNAKTYTKSTFSVLDPYPQHIRILVRMHKLVRKPIQYQHFRFGIQIRMHDTLVSYPMHARKNIEKTEIISTFSVSHPIHHCSLTIVSQLRVLVGSKIRNIVL